MMYYMAIQLKLLITKMPCNTAVNSQMVIRQKAILSQSKSF